MKTGVRTPAGGISGETEAEAGVMYANSGGSMPFIQ